LKDFFRQKKGRHTRLSFLAKQSQTIVLYESPHKIHKLIQQCVEYFGPERNIAIVRELTKVYEEVIRGSAQEVYQQIETRELKGEIVVIIQGNSEKNHDENRED
jgi:16S rRNA (cytidine1402-2'-O)-methyltransferase